MGELVGIYLFLCFCLFWILLGIADYIIRSVAMFRIAKKRQVSNPWLAWIPVANSWIFGSIVDDFESQKGSRRRFRIILLVLQIVLVVLWVVAYSAGIYYIQESYYYGYYALEELSLFLALYAMYLPAMYVAIVDGAIALVCLHKIHENIYPEKSIKYLVISILVPFGYSLCLFKNSKRCEERIFEDDEKEVGED